MALIQKTVLVEYTAQQMFDLVDRVEDYPVFLPWCEGATVHERSERVTRATLQINYHHVRQSFTTRNEKLEGELITITLENGPFRQLDGSWRFRQLGTEACRIDFSLHYEFASRLLERLVGPVFHYIANTLVDAFIKRAEQVYGRR